MTTRPEVIVVGGGVIGCAIAWALSREGVGVELLERDALAARASGVAAGMLTPLAETDAADGLLQLGLESLAELDALLPELVAQSGIDPEVVRSGVLRVARDEAEAIALRAKAERLGAHGLAWVDAAAARSREPGVAPDLLGALWSPHEAHVRGGLLTRAFARAAEGHGAHLHEGTPVVGLVREGERVVGVRTPGGERHAGTVVIAMGAWAPEAAAWFGASAPLPIVPVRGQILELDAPGVRLHTIVWGRDAYLVPRRDGTVTVGATEERVGFDCRVTAQGVRGLLEAAVRLVPGLAEARFVGAWAGLRPDTPDHAPFVGPWPGAPGLVVAAGHYRKGILLAPRTARLVADWVLGKGVAGEARALLPDRGAAPG